MVACVQSFEYEFLLLLHFCVPITPCPGLLSRVKIIVGGAGRRDEYLIWLPISAFLTLLWSITRVELGYAMRNGALRDRAWRFVILVSHFVNQTPEPDWFRQ
ncbi:hypothetical protein F4801DRAFT_331131 [Xylaria longipes]|nr:hypothetical protein F4801DRAFT_331131 [Xylaria longipes]